MRVKTTWCTLTVTVMKWIPCAYCCGCHGSVNNGPSECTAWPTGWLLINTDTLTISELEKIRILKYMRNVCYYLISAGPSYERAIAVQLRRCALHEYSHDMNCTLHVQTSGQWRRSTELQLVTLHIPVSTDNASICNWINAIIAADNRRPDTKDKRTKAAPKPDMCREQHSRCWLYDRLVE